MSLRKFYVQACSSRTKLGPQRPVDAQPHRHPGVHFAEAVAAACWRHANAISMTSLPQLVNASGACCWFVGSELVRPELQPTLLLSICNTRRCSTEQRNTHMRWVQYSGGMEASAAVRGRHDHMDELCAAAAHADGLQGFGD